MNPIFKITINEGGKPFGLIYGCLLDSETGECVSSDTVLGALINACWDIHFIVNAF